MNLEYFFNNKLTSIRVKFEEITIEYKQTNCFADKHSRFKIKI